VTSEFKVRRESLLLSGLKKDDLLRFYGLLAGGITIKDILMKLMFCVKRK
jgi:hypothetical protein